MPAETCAKCGFDGRTWTDAAALGTITQLPDRWADAVAGISPADLRRRPIADRWSIAEYLDHVRESLFGMRFLVDTALAEPGTNLGDPPEAPFEPEPRAVDVNLSLAGLRQEAAALVGRLQETSPDAWASTVIMAGEAVDLHWLARHAVHDATHHLQDVAGLRAHL